VATFIAVDGGVSRLSCSIATFLLIEVTGGALPPPSLLPVVDTASGAGHGPPTPTVATAAETAELQRVVKGGAMKTRARAKRIWCHNMAPIFICKDALIQF
jgi:hypothetical protein